MANDDQRSTSKNSRVQVLAALVGAIGGIVGVRAIGFDHPVEQGLFVASLFAAMVAIPTIVSLRRNRRT